MPFNLKLPSFKTTSPASQTVELNKYLKQLVQELNWALNTLEKNIVTEKPEYTESRDYIYQTGKSGIWNYVKYRSGRAEMWGAANVSQQFTATGSIFFCTNDISLPFTLKEFWYGGGAHQWNYANWCNVVPKDNVQTNVNTITVMSYSNQQTALDSARLFIHVAGAWK